MPELKLLLADNAAAWANEDRAEMASWGLFQFFCSSEANQKILKSLIKTLQNTGAANVNSATQLDKLYPGGVVRLESDFKKWLGQ